jgi:hypothetical protein
MSGRDIEREREREIDMEVGRGVVIISCSLVSCSSYYSRPSKPIFLSYTLRLAH